MNISFEERLHVIRTHKTLREYEEYLASSDFIADKLAAGVPDFNERMKLYRELNRRFRAEGKRGEDDELP